MNLTVRPLPAWPYPERQQRNDLFKATYSDTLGKLEDEVRRLRGSEVIIGLVVAPDQIRLDGRLRADARPRYPGVEVSFEVPGRGRLVFHTDAYRGYADSWQSNLRAIALGLEALRAVDRYGITSTAEQYAGFLQLTGGPNAESGRKLVEEAGGIRQALLKHHPDHGGDPRHFADVQAYRQQQGGS